MCNYALHRPGRDLDHIGNLRVLRIVLDFVRSLARWKSEMKVIIAKIVVVSFIVVLLTAFVDNPKLFASVLIVAVGVGTVFTMGWAIDTIVVDRNQKRKGK